MFFTSATSVFLKQILRFFSFFLTGVAILLILYVHFDPFQVVHNYESFYESGKPRYVTLNYDYVAIETFLINYPSYKYNSFIIGNSRTRFFHVGTWRKYINSDSCFHFDQSNESLYGICKKMEFLDKQGVEIKNALVVLDYSTLIQTKNPKLPLYTSHPRVSGQNMILFHLSFLKYYYSLKFFLAFYDFKISGTIRDYMKKDCILDDTPIEYDLKYNEMKFKIFDGLIATDPSRFYDENRMKLFFLRDSIQQYSPEAIGKDQTVMLRKIKAVFQKHTTDYRIIISPLYDQIKLHEKDLEVLKGIFGTDMVFDFSGINSLTSDYHNYYETSHYRPQVADEIMHAVYAGSKKTDPPNPSSQ